MGQYIFYLSIIFTTTIYFNFKTLEGEDFPTAVVHDGRGGMHGLNKHLWPQLIFSEF